MDSVSPQEQRVGGNDDALETVHSRAALFTVAAHEVVSRPQAARSLGECGIDPARRIASPSSGRHELTSWYTARTSRRRTRPSPACSTPPP
jgi:hypothetical protein